MVRITHEDEITPEWLKCFELLSMPSVSEIESNGPGLFFMKKNGKRYHLEDIALTSEGYVSGIEKSLVPFVKHFKPKSADDEDWDDGYLFEGPLEIVYNKQRIKGRVHIVLPPVTEFPQITIAKKSTSLVSLDMIANAGSMSLEMKEFLEASVKARMTTIFSGGTGSGKTTMLEAMTKYIPKDLRIGVAEDTPELELMQNNVVYLNSVPWRPGLDPNKVATLDWCVAQFNRARTDLLIIGETRGKEFASFLTAANSGMEGCMTTIHSNTPKRSLEKMSNFALKGSDRQPVRAVNTDIANSIDLIVQLKILSNGKHKIDSITEVTNTISKDDTAQITTSPLYEYDVSTDTWEKKSFLSDKLRSTWVERNVDPSPFLKNMGEKQKPHSGGNDSTPYINRESNSSRHGFSGGLPIPGSMSDDGRRII